MPEPLARSSRRVLDPYDRVSEVLFGLIMVLTFTGSLSIADAGRDDVRAMLIGALGCNLAWGIIDGVFYLMGCLAERGRGLDVLRAVRRATHPETARQTILEALPAPVAAVLTAEEAASLHQRLKQLPEPVARVRIRGEDWWGALGVLLLVFLSTFPVVIPFLFLESVRPAMRLSNGIAMVMLFGTGVAFGRIIGRKAWLMGILMVVLGGVLVALTMALGG